MAQISAVKSTTFPSNSKWFVVKETNNRENKENTGNGFASLVYSDQVLGHEYDIKCVWETLRDQILLQWPRLSIAEVNEAGPNRRYLAALISGKYGVDVKLIINYLRNLERHLPLI